jgi:hypothetical protein
MVRRTAPPPDPPKMNPPKPAASAPAPKAAPQAHPKPAPEPAAGSTSTASPQQAMEPAVEPMKDPHERKLGDGKQHGMKPVDFPHPDKIHTFSDLTKAMGGTTAKLTLIDDFTPQQSRHFEVARAYRFAKGSGLYVEFLTLNGGKYSPGASPGAGRRNGSENSRHRGNDHERAFHGIVTPPPIDGSLRHCGRANKAVFTR